MKKQSKKTLTRRDALVMGVKTVSTLAVGSYVLGCDAELAEALNNAADNMDDDTDTDSDSETSYSGSWASGGTDLITGDFPSDSLFTASNMCSVALTESATLGPCYFQDSSGEDISEGKEGLPMQLCIRLVDSNCNPLSNYTIEVWHCDIEGIYSGDTSSSDDSSSFAGSFCTDSDSEALKSTWFRGQLTTDSNGRVNFKSCFPGWYSGRTIHIHFAISDSSGGRYLISQFCFADSFTKTICTEHDKYSSRGEQDTTLASGKDTVFPSGDYEEFMMTTEQNSDGTLLAYHTIKLI